MQVITLKDQLIHGHPVKAGKLVRVGAAYGAKLIREGAAKLDKEDPPKKLETK